MALNVKLQQWQSDLLDLSRANPLLNYKTSGRGSGVQMLEPPAGQLYSNLLRSASASVALNWVEEGKDQGEVEELIRKLARLRSRTTEDMRDRGLQTLYLAFGLLEWLESPNSQERTLTPLLLLPVTLGRKGTFGAFTITRASDDDPEVNPVFREKMRNDFHITVPAFDGLAVALQGRMRADNEEDEEGDEAPQSSKGAVTLTSLLNCLVAELPAEIDPTIREEAHLGRFSFHKLVMYHDLRKHESEINTHTLIRAIGGDRVAVPQPERLIEAREIDTLVSPREIMEILDADSSQQEAILAAKAGANFVLQGPPGTGKSQTIANIIAECLGAGQKVLFVSEKMAALEVVWKRLRDAKLDDFLLNLHDPRQKRDGFLRNLTSSLHNPSDTADSTREWDATSARLEQERNELNAYVRELHAPRFALQISAFEAYGQLAALHSATRLDFTLSNVTDINEHELAHLGRLLDDLREHLDILDRFNEHPWRETLLEQYSISRENDIQAHLTQMSDALLACTADGAQLYSIVGSDRMRLADPETDYTPTVDQLRQACAIAEHALNAPFPPVRIWLSAAQSNELLVVAAQAQNRCDAYHAETAELDSHYRRSICDEDLDALRVALTSSCADAVAALARSGGDQPEHDVALQRRAQIASLVATSARRLAELLEAARAIAAPLDLPIPSTTQDAERLNEFVQHILRSPRPPQSWLDADAFPSVAVLATDSHERVALARSLRERLGSVYRDDFFSLDIPAIEDRFRTRYHSIFRVFNGQYRTDAKSLRLCLRSDGAPVKRGHAELLADVTVAKQALAAEGWVRDHRADLASALGRLYNVQNPDWDSIVSAVGWTQRFHQMVVLMSSTGSAPSSLQALVTTGGATLESFRPHAAALSTALENWRQLIAPLQSIVNIARLLGSAVIPVTAPMETLRHGLDAMRQGLEALWRAADTIVAHRLPADGAASWAELTHTIEISRSIVAAEHWLDQRAEEYRGSFGERFTGFETDWNALQDGLRWSHALATLFPLGVVPGALVDRLAEDTDPAGWDELERLADATSNAVTTFDQELEFVTTILPDSALRTAGQAPGKIPVNDLGHTVRTLLDTLPDLERLMAGRLHVQECREAGLGSLLDAALARNPFPRDITSIFEQRFYAIWLDAARTASRELGRFSGERHEATIARYRLLEREHLELTRKRLRARLLSQRIVSLRAADVQRDTPKGQALARLRKIAGQKRPRGSIRQLVRSLGPILLDLKPCWMMSPLSVSQFVEESAPIFDVVVFDEASQVRPEDAICSILRARRLIVVGDSKQLPPTQFFTKEHRDDDEDERDAIDDLLDNGRRESILEECSATGMPHRSLLWHYRSRHESLIAFSNHHFYDDKLITFPNPGDSHLDGVRFDYVADGVYDFGASRTNQREAERVVDLIFEHLRRRPHLSLGVVALSAAQQESIENALESRQKQDPEANAFTELLDEDRPEGLFIKNLESVQGDERDVIILSIGYGRASDGRIRYNFGPVNRNGGARRLNVAVTRAREQTIIVSSVRANEFSDSLASEGARILRAYLDYAERGVAALHDAHADVSEQRFDSPFEEAVCRALEDRGLQVATQVGCSGYRIDLAVRDPKMSERFLLGIECDGRSYHSSKTARDRDRLRQPHLEHMGWKILRIWSSEWRRDPDGQVARVMQRVREIREEMDRARTNIVSEPAVVHAWAEREDEAARGRDASATTPSTESARPHSSGAESVKPAVPHVTGPNFSRPATSAVQRAAAAAHAQHASYAPPGTETGQLHQVATWAGGEFVCETCAHFTALRLGRFTCSKLQRTQVQALKGHTPCCTWWKVK